MLVTSPQVFFRRRRQCGADPPGRFSLTCGCGVEYTPRWVGTSGLHTERSDRPWVTLIFAFNEAVESRGRGPGVHKVLI